MLECVSVRVIEMKKKISRIVRKIIGDLVADFGVRDKMQSHKV